MPKILEGKIAKAHYIEVLKERVSKMPKMKLVIIQIGDRADTNTYINAKIKFGQKIGIDVVCKKYDIDVAEQTILEKIKELNDDVDVTGVILQLPIPPHLDKKKILDSIKAEKDPDGLNTANKKIIPATARGVFEMLDFYNIDVYGKSVVIVGRSKLVGTPIAKIALRRGAKVTVCSSKTLNIREKTKSADILIVAIGKARYIDSSYVKEGQVVIDIGINRSDSIPLGISGDVDYEGVRDMVGAISPVPGGVGQMTVLALFENLVDLASDFTR